LKEKHAQKVRRRVIRLKVEMSVVSGSFFNSRGDLYKICHNEFNDFGIKKVFSVQISFDLLILPQT